MAQKKILTGTIVFSLLAFLLPLSNFLLLPIYTKYFPPSEYAVLAILTSFTNLIASIGAFRISVALNPYYFEYKDSPKEFNQFYGNILLFTIISGALTLLVGFVFGDMLFKLVLKNDQSIPFFPLGIIALIIGLLTTFKSPYVVLLRLEKDVYKYALFFCLNAFLVIVLQLLFVIYFEVGIIGVLIARMGAEFVGAIIIFYHGFSFMRYKLNKKHLVQALRFCIPIIPTGFIGWVYAFGDRFFIERFIDLRSLGIYSILIAITGLVTMLSDALSNGIVPYLYDYYAEGVKKNMDNINKILRFYIHSILLSCSFLIMLGCNLNLFIVNVDYIGIYKFVSIGVIVFLIEAYYKIYFNNLIYLKKSKSILYLSFSSIAIVFILYLLFIPVFGIWGVILSNVIGNIVILLFAYYYSQQKLTIILNVKQLIVVPSVVVFTFFLTELFIYVDRLNYSFIGIFQFILIFSFLTIINVKELNSLIKNFKN